MPIRLSRFEMPKSVQKDVDTATGTYARFIAEPFEIGYARTIGNSLRRVLLSSIEGCAISSVRFCMVGLNTTTRSPSESMRAAITRRASSPSFFIE